ncbi:hypothetical protein [Actinomadura sp. J1-007]|nr:hypothetical protein [Actinomadura sp. J1-007]
MTTDQITDAMPFARALGVEIDTAGPDGVAGRLAWAPSAAPPEGSCTAA